MAIYKVGAFWEMYGFLTVEANSPQEALAIAEAQKDDCLLPEPAFYVDESFHIDTEELPMRADRIPD